MPNQEKKVRKGGFSAKEIVLLGVISEEPIHAYGLEEKIQKRHMLEWTDIALSSMYRLIAGLEEDGLIASRLEHAGQGATRKVLEITAAGRDALAQGVLEQLADLRPVKDPFAVGLTFLSHAPRAEACACLRKRARKLDEAMHELNGIAGEHLGKAACFGAPSRVLSPQQQLSIKLLFDYLDAHMHAQRGFLEQTIARLSAAEPSEEPAPANTGSQMDSEVKR